MLQIVKSARSSKTYGRQPVVTILICLMGLPFAPLLNLSPGISWVLLVIVLVFSGISIVSLGKLVNSALLGAPTMIELFFP